LCRSEQPNCRLRFLGVIATRHKGVQHMNGIIYLVGLVVVIMAILSFFGLR
jgi:hypothetical protein